MSGADSESTNYVCNGNVRENSQTFNPGLYSKVGAVVGYPGPNNGVAAAAGNPGPKIVSDVTSSSDVVASNVMVGGNRSPAIGPNYQSFVNAEDGVYGKGYAPLTVENNNMPVKMSGGKKRRRSKYSKKAKKYHKKSTKRSNRKSTKRSNRKSSKKRKTMKKRGMLTNLKKMLGMAGGAPPTDLEAALVSLGYPRPKQLDEILGELYYRNEGPEHLHTRKMISQVKTKLDELEKRINQLSLNQAAMDTHSGMKGGNPANFTPDPSVESDRQFLNNQEKGFTNSYTQGGELSPSENALANPTLTTATNNC